MGGLSVNVAVGAVGIQKQQITYLTVSVGPKGEPSNAGRDGWFSRPTLRLAACVQRSITPPPLGERNVFIRDFESVSAASWTTQTWKRCAIGCRKAGVHVQLGCNFPRDPRRL